MWATKHLGGRNVPPSVNFHLDTEGVLRCHLVQTWLLEDQPVLISPPLLSALTPIANHSKKYTVTRKNALVDTAPKSKF